MDSRPACGFCDGTGLWVDPEGGPAGTDPCPLCEGSGDAPGTGARSEVAAAAPEALDLGRLVALLPRLTQAERQRLYEELYTRYDCRIYR